MANSHL